MTLREFPKRKTVKRIKKKMYTYPRSVVEVPEEQKNGKGPYGIQFVKFPLSSNPGGYNVLEIHYFFPTLQERNRELAAMRKRIKRSKKYGPIIEGFVLEVTNDHP